MSVWTPELEAELRMLVLREWTRMKIDSRRARCDGKHRFPSPQAARAKVRKSDMEAFWCRSCGGWHVAHVNRARRLVMERVRVA